MTQTSGQRQRILYKSKVEYTTEPGVYACSYVVGCAHGCTYCYASKMAHRFGHTTADQWRSSHLIDNWRDLLDHDLSVKRKDPIRRVFMCFSSDPFPYSGDNSDEIRDASLEIIRTLNDRDIPVTTLSKGVYPWADLTDLHPDNEYGATITTMRDAYAWICEPFAASPLDRLRSLIHLATHDCRTWLSIEPFGILHPNPYQAQDAHAGLEDILQLTGFVDRIVFGRAHYCRDAVKDDDWYSECAGIVAEACRLNDIEYIIKNGTPHDKDGGQ